MDGAEKELLVIMPKDAQQTENARLDAVLEMAAEDTAGAI